MGGLRGPVWVTLRKIALMGTPARTHYREFSQAGAQRVDRCVQDCQCLLQHLVRTERWRIERNDDTYTANCSFVNLTIGTILGM